MTFRTQIILSIFLIFFSAGSTITTINVSEAQPENSSQNVNATSTGNAKGDDLILNPLFDKSNKTAALPSNWNDQFSSCIKIFECDINVEDGWPATQSFQLSTQNNTNQTWSWISSDVFDVQPQENYEISSHMKLNKYASDSHIVLQGFNDTSQEWYQIEQCPTGTSGPLKWTEFNCRITIPAQTSSLIVILNAGWSSEKGQDAVTLFDAVHVNKVA